MDKRTEGQTDGKSKTIRLPTLMEGTITRKFKSITYCRGKKKTQFVETVVMSKISVTTFKICKNYILFTNTTVQISSAVCWFPKITCMHFWNLSFSVQDMF